MSLGCPAFGSWPSRQCQVWAPSQGSMGLKLDQSLVCHSHKFYITYTPAQTAEWLRVPTYSLIDMHVCAHLCLCTICMQCLRRPEEDFVHLELELQIVVSCHIGVGGQPWSSARTAGALNC